MRVPESTLQAPLASWRASKLAFASRILLGLILVSGGINNLELGDRVNPYPTPEGDRVLHLLRETGYLLYALAFTEIAAGVNHTCALLSGGAVRCWGDGASGRLGYGNTNNIGDNETPASAGDVDVGGTVTEIAAGRHTCALLSTGAVRCSPDVRAENPPGFRHVRQG